jgi:hypothetical protein
MIGIVRSIFRLSLQTVGLRTLVHVDDSEVSSEIYLLNPSKRQNKAIAEIAF